MRPIFMMHETVRTQIVFPRDVVEAVDRVAGKRGRSEFVISAVREKLTRQSQLEALDKSVGILADSDHPEWETPEKVSRWVRSLRKESDETMTEKLHGSST
jgi:metal-responsive CopG/Arc/MetJ family transcriptional regulator